MKLELNDKFVNPVFIKNLYPEGVPLNDIEIFNFMVERDGPSVKISIKLSELPEKENLPKKWEVNNKTYVMLGLNFIDVDSLKIEGWGCNNTGGGYVDYENDYFHVGFSGDSFKISFDAKFIQVVSVSPVNDEEAD